MVKESPKSISPTEKEPEFPEQDHFGLERLIFFSDAVFAIAITLLALEVRLPAGVEAFNDAQLFASLLGMWQKYLAYIISFLVIGSFWNAHHRKFRFIRRYDATLRILNLLILMVVAFIPFPSSVISESGTRTATIFYALTVMLVGLLYAALWWYAARHDHLIVAHLTTQQRRREFIAPLTTVSIFFISIGVTYLNINLARFLWLLALPISSIVYRRQPAAHQKVF
jgi:uncharacterized membrane protein